MARLATVDGAGHPHLVPFVLAAQGATIYSAVDSKPKSSKALRRLDNVRTNPHVSVLVDHYDDSDWSTLWWARADGTARVLDPGSEEGHLAIGLLSRRYRQYSERPAEGPVLAVDVERWSGWEASGAGE